MKRFHRILAAFAAIALLIPALALGEQTPCHPVDAMEAIRREYGENVFDGYTLWGPKEDSSAKFLLGAAPDGSLCCWSVEYSEHVQLSKVADRKLEVVENYSSLALIAPRFSGVAAEAMTVYDVHQSNLITGEPCEFFYTYDELYGYRSWSIIYYADGTVRQVDSFEFSYVYSLAEMQAVLDGWLAEAFPDEGFKAADFEAKLSDDGCTFTLNLPRPLEGHPAGMQMIIEYDREQNMTRFLYFEE